MTFTDEELKIIRKSLQITRMAHMVISTDEGEDYKDTRVDALIRKIKAIEDNEKKID